MSMSMAYSDMEESVKTVQVRFFTELEEEAYKVPTSSFAIPSNLTRLGLSSLVNNLLTSLNSDWEAQPFDFLINGELIRMSLEEFLLAKGISAEKILDIEYIKAVAPRKQEEPSLHDDWVSSVDGSNPGVIVTGCYDSCGRVWKGAGTCSHVLGGHSDALTSICIVNTNQNVNDIQVATASKDRTLRLWKFDADDSTNYPARVTAYKVLHGHTAGVQCVSSQPSGQKVCSGSWDSTINLWQTSCSDVDGDLVSIKKRKKRGAAEETQSEGEAVSTLVGHTNCVSCVKWPKDDTIYSASWDHSIRIWDVETGKATWSLFCGKVLNYLDVGENSSLVAAGASDGTLRIWDPRRPGTIAPAYQFSSHTNWISSCKWHNKSWFHLASASYDGKVMIWDLRTAWPLSVIGSHDDKVLSVDWWNGDAIVSGGADSKMCISSGISVP